MNIFGAFSFGSLIKTFLPGFVWLVAVALFEADVSDMLGSPPAIWHFAETHEQASLVLAIPASILLGLLSNIIVFLGLNDWLVRKPVRKANQGLFALHDRLTLQIREQSWARMRVVDPGLRSAFIEHADAELIILPSIGLDKLSYTREQYWYHLEFQVNLILSILMIFLAAVIHLITVAARMEFWLDNVIDISVYLLVYFLIAGALCIILCRAARKNYLRHIAKMLSLMAAALGPLPRQS